MTMPTVTRTRCYICFEDDCTKPECQKILDDMWAAEAEYRQQERRRAVVELLKQRLKGGDENRLQRWIYTFKGLVCLLLGRRGPSQSCVSECAVWNWGTDSCEGAPSNAASWTELAIGRGLFRNWHYAIYDNSSW